MLHILIRIEAKETWVTIINKNRYCQLFGLLVSSLYSCINCTHA
jgi:hypothetical protein